MSEESDALLHIADDHPCCKPTLLWAHNRLLELERENAALRTQNEELFSGLVVAEREMEGCLNNGKLPAWSLDCVRAVISGVRKEEQP